MDAIFKKKIHIISKEFYHFDYIFMEICSSLSTDDKSLFVKVMAWCLQL